jgi:glycosyltransferase involved in cell wall biosynthesis
MEPEPVCAAHQAVYDSNPARYIKVRADVLATGEIPTTKRFLQAGVIAAHLLRHPVDAMHAHFASSAARVAYYVNQLIGVPYSFTAHAKDIFHQEVKPDSLREKIANARFVVTVSDFNRGYLQDLMNGRPGDIRRLYNGIDLTRFRPDPDVRREPNLILSVGRLVEKKGFDDLIRACHHLARRPVDFCCEIIGKGPLKNQLQTLIDDLGLQRRVKLVGPKPQDGVLDAYKRARERWQSGWPAHRPAGSDGHRPAGRLYQPDRCAGDH